MNNVTAFWNGGGTLDKLNLQRSMVSGKYVIRVISGANFHTLLFVSGVPFIIGVFLMFESFFRFSLVVLLFSSSFIVLGIVLIVLGQWYRQDNYFFATEWVTVTDKRITFRNGDTREIVDLCRISSETSYVPNGEGGESIGWVINFETRFGECYSYQYLFLDDFRILRKLIEETPMLSSLKTDP